ncbi:peptide chain release factor N(5)-glutamine methyltransferase [Sulfuritalea sp.]|uniref:peptide chain release factor N(5)-glutamine methyltransferase n=1 Tax=Sulfuritalea sp. TaxID=2480090 RepID=UPI00286E81B6|nr:peptide chain release factor N(5)-glutamine methyltransferase [Sulfuritalea sp.]
MTTVAAALVAARAKLPAGEARLLLGHVLQQSAAWLLAHDDQVLDEDELLAFASLVARRAGGEPIAYLVGFREFFGREFEVSSAVLIPRPETELLIEIALAKVGACRPAVSTHPGFRFAAGERNSRQAESAAARILDLGTGSGCIAVTLALEIPQAQLAAVDASAAALLIARKNAERLGAHVRFLQSDWFSALGGERFDLIVANPPYIAAADPHLAAGDLRHEPAAALASGADGLDAIRCILAAAPAHLASGGWLWLEHGYDQAEPVRELLAAAGLADIEQCRDLAGIIRASGGRLK